MSMAVAVPVCSPHVTDLQGLWWGSRTKLARHHARNSRWRREPTYAWPGHMWEDQGMHMYDKRMRHASACGMGNASA